MRGVPATHPPECILGVRCGGFSEGCVVTLACVGPAAAPGLHAGTQLGLVRIVVTQEQVVNGVGPTEAVQHHHTHVTLHAPQLVTCSGKDDITYSIT